MHRPRSMRLLAGVWKRQGRVLPTAVLGCDPELPKVWQEDISAGLW